MLSIPHPVGNHNGGQLQFGPDGYLYIATGDGGGGGDPDRNGQNLNSLLGKLLRIDPRLGPNGESYTIPTDNPFVGQTGARAEIWSYGLRNPWRFSFDRLTGDLTVGDVGQGEWEEVNFVPAGSGAGRRANFGWGCFEGRHVYVPNASRPDCNPLPTNHAQPVWEYSHVRGCSIAGGYVVRDPELTALVGRYLYGDLCDDRVWSTILQVPDAQDDRVTGLEVPSLYSFGEDACGRIYAVSGAGPVYRLHVSGQPDTPTCTPPVQPPPVAPPPPARPAAAAASPPRLNRHDSPTAGCRASSAYDLPQRGRASGGPTAGSAVSGTGGPRSLAAGCSRRPLGQGPAVLAARASASRSAAARGPRELSAARGACARSGGCRASATASGA